MSQVHMYLTKAGTSLLDNTELIDSIYKICLMSDPYIQWQRQWFSWEQCLPGQVYNPEIKKFYNIMFHNQPQQ